MLLSQEKISQLEITYGIHTATSELRNFLKKKRFLDAFLRKESDGTLSTRELADTCGESIYCTRHILLSLELEGSVEKVKNGRSLYWRLTSS